MSWQLTGNAVRFHHVMAAVKSHDLDQARELLAKLEAEYPLDEDVWMWKAGVARSPAEAARALERVLTINPSNDRAMRALTMTRICSSDETATLKKTAIPFNCKVCGLKHWQAFQTCRACGCLWDVTDLNAMLNNQKAVRTFLHGVVADLEQRRGPEAALAAAVGRLNLGDLDGALEMFRRAHDLRPSDPRFAQWVRKIEQCRLVMAVDDCRTVLAAISSVLGRNGITVRTAASGEEAMSALERLRPEAVLLDVKMPGMDGYQTCKAIRKLPGGGAIPVLMISASLMDRIKGRLAGANGYLPKPFDATTLVAAVNPYLERAVGAPRAPRAAAAGEAYTAA